MSEVNVTKVIVNNPICDILDPFVFTIEFEALNKLEADLEWKIFYISAVNNEGESNQDIELDNIYLGPIERGVMMFDYAVNPPDYKNMDTDSVLGLQAILISANYKEKEFIRIAYYMNSFYKDIELREKPPMSPQYDKICRHIFVDNPRIVKFTIPWDSEERDEFKEFDKENEKIELLNFSKIKEENQSNSNITNQSTQDHILIPNGLNEYNPNNGNFNITLNNNMQTNMNAFDYLKNNEVLPDMDRCEILNENIKGISSITIDNKNMQ
ncbi:histone chaperone ASF1, putative [Plasmodium berghei]|uniref:Histone chaperone ASF1, putative n=2 Tax=Plasmodium berghei TaxID=5821 RepID=A0A509AQZ1_PLABA|nr:histone chaperone ASF1, putative [Plasmodium berghei ANKA]CXJ22491.1 histone chaperone ASF1, putative [Plasmodium berghei]SCM26664.1 histone chaperone ASF1, putative [Plasmodium berghei]SCN28573.1 histone chaperone ASF1, putative [Plasmodium berghei]SCO62762.1 histone chaperone ASF1, putative [Plasmodium berghei]SCO64322.1 histone chaperone ASF1, putative [Plasmodium berghei]|eukprot:XP_034424218.1 histone chaperone ASF1, putative [Plasmodium berghei ANKA]